MELAPSTLCVYLVLQYFRNGAPPFQGEIMVKKVKQKEVRSNVKEIT